MQMACSARLTYSPSLLSDLCFGEGDAVSERCDCVASWARAPLQWLFNEKVFGSPLRNQWDSYTFGFTSTIYSHSYSCAATKKCLIILNVFICVM